MGSPTATAEGEVAAGASLAGAGWQQGSARQAGCRIDGWMARLSSRRRVTSFLVEISRSA